LHYTLRRFGIDNHLCRPATSTAARVRKNTNTAVF
jgi:hypothetical protein